MVAWLGGQLSRGVSWLWQRAALWVDPEVFGVEGEIFLGPTSSGDTTFAERPEPGRMILRGSFEGREIEVALSARDLDEMLLISRGYHWINERPFNR